MLTFAPRRQNSRTRNVFLCEKSLFLQKIPVTAVSHDTRTTRRGGKV